MSSGIFLEEPGVFFMESRSDQSLDYTQDLAQE